MKKSSLVKAYELAKERYAAMGVDTEVAISRLANIPISLHCWQGDDVLGFEDPLRGLSGGIMTTGRLSRQSPHSNRTAF